MDLGFGRRIGGCLLPRADETNGCVGLYEDEVECVGGSASVPKGSVDVSICAFAVAVKQRLLRGVEVLFDQ